MYLRDEAAHFVPHAPLLLKYAALEIPGILSQETWYSLIKDTSSIVTLIYLENHWLERKVQKVGKTKLVVLSDVLLAQTQMLRNQISVASKTNLNFKLTLVM